jgi:hypothetical protein
MAVCLLGIMGAATAETQIHSSQYAKWYVYDMSFYNQFKSNIDEVMGILDRGIPGIVSRLGVTPDLPITVHIEQGEDGWGGWAGGGEVGYTSSCFRDQAGMNWIKGVVIGECVNVTTGKVTGDWPVDWWVDGVWYFPGFVVVDVLKEADNATTATKWETDEHYPTYPVYNLFRSLLTEFGWEYYKDFFARITDDDMDWFRVGTNPSNIKTNYIIAYMSLIAGRNLAGSFQTAKVSAAEATVIEDIMGVEQMLRSADAQNKNTSSAWDSFRNGNYAQAQQALFDMGMTAVRHIQPQQVGRSTPNNVVVYSLQGQRLYAGSLTGLKAALTKKICKSEAVIVNYRQNTKILRTEKVLLDR